MKRIAAIAIALLLSSGADASETCDARVSVEGIGLGKVGKDPVYLGRFTITAGTRPSGIRIYREHSLRMADASWARLERFEGAKWTARSLVIEDAVSTTRPTRIKAGRSLDFVVDLNEVVALEQGSGTYEYRLVLDLADGCKAYSNTFRLPTPVETKR